MATSSIIHEFVIEGEAEERCTQAAGDSFIDSVEEMPIDMTVLMPKDPEVVERPVSKRNSVVLDIEEIICKIKPIAEKYEIEKIYLFGSYARGEADNESDIDFIVFGGENFKKTLIFAFGEDLRETFKKKIDVFEISEINTNSNFYDNFNKDKVLVYKKEW